MFSTSESIYIALCNWRFYSRFINISLDSSIKKGVKGSNKTNQTHKKIPFLTNQAGTKATRIQALITDSLLRWDLKNASVTSAHPPAYLSDDSYTFKVVDSSFSWIYISRWQKKSLWCTQACMDTKLPSKWCELNILSPWFWVLFVRKKSDGQCNSFCSIILSHQSWKKFNLIGSYIHLWINQSNGLGFY